MRKPLLSGALLTAALAAAAPAQGDTNDALNIPYTMHKLDNGMVVILHEDHNQPLVTVNVNVNVGSRDEKDKRTGFAHLFEHLMFMGTKRVPEKMYDAWMEGEGGWNNAWTSNDRTDYYDVGPSHILPLLLWMEADRLSELGKQINQSKLDKQRDVVRNERRQTSENEPYGIAELILPELTFPDGDPYHHPVIGSHADLEAASVSDVRAFFAEHYVPESMSMVIAGDFDPDKVMPLVKTWFGSIPKAKSPPQRGSVTKPAVINGVVRKTVDDNVTLPKLTMTWLSPAHFAPGDAELDMVAEVLSEGKSSKLYKALVYEKKIAQTVSAYQDSRTLRSTFNIEVIAEEGVSLDTIETEVDAIIADVRANKVSARELNRFKNQYESGFIRRMQSLSTRASLLNGYYAENANPGYAAMDLQRYMDLKEEDLQAAAQKYLDPNARVILRIMPRPQKEAQTEGEGS